MTASDWAERVAQSFGSKFAFVVILGDKDDPLTMRVGVASDPPRPMSSTEAARLLRLTADMIEKT